MGGEIDGVTRERRDWALVVAICVPVAVLSIDFAGVVVALPAIGTDLGVAQDRLGWVVSAFALGSAAPLIVAGRVADTTGRRRLLLAGLWCFLAGTVACLAAPDFGVLVGGRLVQGVGMALFMTASLGALSAGTVEPFRTRAVGVWSAVGGLALAVGPLVGGVLTDLGSWRWFFLADVPPLLLGLVLVHRSVQDVPAGAGGGAAGRRSALDGHAAGGPIGAGGASDDDAAQAQGGTAWRDAGPERGPGDRPARVPLDPWSAVASILAVTALTSAVQTVGTRGWASPATLAGAVVAVAAAVVFARRERRPDPPPIVDPVLWRRPAFWTPVAVALLANVAFGSLQFLLTLALQDVAGWTPLEAGGAFLLYSAPFAAVGLRIGRLTARLGARRALVLGQVLIAVSFVAVAALADTSVVTASCVGLAVAGLGQGLAFTLTTSTSLAAAPATDASVASGLLTTLRNLGIVAGITVATLALGRAGGGVPDTVTAGAAAGAATTAAFADGLRLASFVLAAVSLAGAAVAARLPVGD